MIWGGGTNLVQGLSKSAHFPPGPDKRRPPLEDATPDDGATSLLRFIIAISSGFHSERAAKCPSVTAVNRLTL